MSSARREQAGRRAEEQDAEATEGGFGTGLRAQLQKRRGEQPEEQRCPRPRTAGRDAARSGRPLHVGTAPDQRRRAELRRPRSCAASSPRLRSASGNYARPSPSRSRPTSGRSPRSTTSRASRRSSTNAAPSFRAPRSRSASASRTRERAQGAERRASAASPRFRTRSQQPNLLPPSCRRSSRRATPS